MEGVNGAEFITKEAYDEIKAFISANYNLKSI
jgi:hypothetical protein